MITEAYGNLLDAETDALVNAVNTVGVMGKGIALEFKQAYPEMFKAYAKAAKAGQIRLGHMHLWPTGRSARPRFVINFPTKGHWRSPSKIDDIELGLTDLVRALRDHEITSVAIPPLGCGSGGLRWPDVEPLIRDAMSALPEVEVVLYPPESATSAGSP